MGTNETGRESNQLVPFTFEDRAVRTVAIDGETWWVGKDVCDVLGIANSRDAVGRLEDYEKLVSEISTSGQRRQIWLVNESGVYSLTLTSNKPKAKKFKRWLTTEVLPQIRRAGGYGAPFSLSVAGRAYSFFSGMSVRRINKLFFLCSVEPPLLQEDIAYLVGMSEGTLSTFLKRFGRREFGKIVRELRIDAYGCSALYAADRAKKARISLTAKGAKFCRKSLTAEGGAV